ncbi:hypothetical protein BU17DRAFT_65186 [Hysterangium stoloniferum]|nr:hypothetical protein BU17DRAFT_65186 [Hysterangium stoloniferum]
MSVQKHTLSYPTSVNQSVMGSSPSQVDVSTLGDIALWEEFSSNAVYPEENASNHICHPVHGTASYARHSAIPDFDFASGDTFPQVVDWNINGQSMGESSSVMDSSVLGGSYPNPSPETSSPFEPFASTSRPLIPLPFSNTRGVVSHQLLMMVVSYFTGRQWSVSAYEKHWWPTI